MRLTTLFLGAAVLVGLGCQSTENAAWAAFKRCGSNACVQEALAVKAAFLKDPETLLRDFLNTYEQGDDHLIGWLYLMRDSVLTHSEAGAYEERVGWRDEIVQAAKPYAEHPKWGAIARVIVDEMEAIAIAAEREDGPEALASPVFVGTYALAGEGHAAAGELWVSETAGDSLRFRLLAVGPAPAHNQGVLAGTAAVVSANAARFATREFGSECTLYFRWSGDSTVYVHTEQGDPAACGLGAGVVPDGTYSRKRYEDPFLSAAEAQKAALLEGEWQSVQDPKNTLRIAQGRITHLYEGREVEPPVRYAYFSQCPANCSPAAEVPCIRTFGQDFVCYTIVKADGKTLELSLIGGAGNTNRYTRKK